MDIIRKNISINEILRGGAEYLGSGASKEAFEKDGVVYKIPRGRYLIEREGGNPLVENFPTHMSDVDEFLEQVEEFDPALVWPLGQFAIEIIVWNAIEQLESEGLIIEHLARLQEVFLDANGVIVIKQEKTERVPYLEAAEENEEAMSDLETELTLLEPILKDRFDIALRDVRYENCGYGADNKLKLFDFGISTTTQLDLYDGYSW